MTDTKEAEVKMLFRIIKDKTGYTQKQLKGERGNQEKSHVRRAFFAICRNLLDLTSGAAGELIDRDHSTALAAVKKHNIEIDAYADYTKIYKSLYKDLESLYIFQTEFDVDYIQARIDLLKLQREIIDNQIKRYQKKLNKVDAGEK